jgi:hypothetical protein
MTSANPLVTPAATAPRPVPMAQPASNQPTHHHHPPDSPPPNGVCPGHAHETRPAPAPPANGSNNKKGKGKKAMDSSEASKLVAARISQLELDAAGEKDQEAEIGASSSSLLRFLQDCRGGYGWCTASGVQSRKGVCLRWNYTSTLEPYVKVTIAYPSRPGLRYSAKVLCHDGGSHS